MWSALSIAAVTGQLEACELLLSMLDKFGSFPRDALASLRQALVAVPDLGFVWFCTTLLEQSVCCNAGKGLVLELRLLSLLRNAVDADQLEIVKLLLNSGANARALRNSSPMMKAAHARGQFAIFDLLVSRGARLPPGIISPAGDSRTAPSR